MARLMLVRGGVEVMGQTASLLAKAAPSLPHHSSIGSLSQPMTIFGSVAKVRGCLRGRTNQIYCASGIRRKEDPPLLSSVI